MAQSKPEDFIRNPLDIAISAFIKYDQWLSEYIKENDQKFKEIILRKEGKKL